MTAYCNSKLGRFACKGNREKQSGIATILVVVLLGMSMTAMALGYMFSLQNTQEKQVAVHASTHSQVGLWSGVEAFRRYLAVADNDSLDGLEAVGAFDINMGANYGSITAKNITVTAVDSVFHVSTDIVNLHADSKSSAALGVTYVVDPHFSEGPPPRDLSAVINFYDSLTLSGDITFNLVGGDGATVNVDGDVAMDNINVNNLDILNATGAVRVGSAVQLDQIHSGDDVLLLGGARVNTVLTEGSVETQAGAGADIIRANKAVLLGGSRRSESVSSLETISVNAGSHGKLNALGNIIIGSTGVGTIDEIETQANVNILTGDSVGTTLLSIIAEGDTNCEPVNWGVVVNLYINGDLDTDCDTSLWTSFNADAGVSVSVMDPVSPVSMPPVIIDVWALRDQANYIFEYDNDKGQTKVTVNNINGVANGSEFYIGSYNDNHKSYLCTAVNPLGKCTAPVTPDMPICLGHSTWNECIFYGPIDGSGETDSIGWTFDGMAAAPGILWFDGGVNLNNGKNYATILATGDVITGGQLELYSTNYGGYDGVCTASGAALSANATYQVMFEDQYPTNLCDKTNGVYIPSQTGNIGIAAGGYSGEPPIFSGGRVMLGTNNQIFGSVLAGQTLTTEGQTVVHGYVTAAAQSGKVDSGTANLLGANSRIDLTNAVDTYDASDVPSMGEVDPVPDPTPANPYRIERSRVLWSKYL